MVHLIINNTDVTEQYGIIPLEGAIVALMTPVPNKEYVENKPTMAHGKQVLITNTYRDERDITLPIGIKASSQSAMLTSYNELCKILYGGKVDIRLMEGKANIMGGTTTYHLCYQSCAQVQTFFRGIAKFNIKFNEPNPNNRVL